MKRRIIFMGSDAIALPALDWIWNSPESPAQLVAVYTQPDRPRGRGQKLMPNAIKAWALERGLPVHQPEKLTPGALENFRAIGADATLVMAYGHILRQSWIDAQPSGIWNLHASLLPKLRGASPIQGAIVSGERESGVCLMRVVLALDAGPVLDCERVSIDPLETGATLEEKLARCCVPLLRRSLGKIFAPEPPLTEQDHARATFTRRLRKADGVLDFAADAATLARRVNGLFPWPGVSVEIDGVRVRLGLAAAEPGEDTGVNAAPGTVLPGDGDAVRVATGDGVLRLLRLQRPGGRMMPAADFLRGHPIAPGTVLPSQPMPELVAAEPLKG